MEQFIVIALATSTAPAFEDCQIVPADASFVATHKQVFGPASKEECEKWVAENSERTPDGNYLPSDDTKYEIEANRGKIVILGIYLLLIIFFSVYLLAALMMAETDKAKIDEKCCRTPTPTPTATPTSDTTPSPAPTATPTPSPTATATVASPIPANSGAAAGNAATASPSPAKTPTPSPTPSSDLNFVKADIPAEVYVRIPLIWSGALSADGYVLLVVFFSGMLGAVIRAIYSFVGHLGFRNFSFNWTWFYLSLPFTGAALSLVVYFVMRGGFYGGTFGKGLVLNLFSFAALAALTGLFTDHAMGKLKQVAETLLSDVPPKVGNAKEIVEKKEADQAKK